MESTFKISGMTCDGCKKVVSNAISKIKGVEDVSINLETMDVKVVSTDAISDEEIAEALKNFPSYQLVEENQF